MKCLFDLIAERTKTEGRTNTSTTALLLTCSIFLVMLGVGSVTGGLSPILFTNSYGQLEEQIATVTEEKELEAEGQSDQVQADQTTETPNRLSLRLDRAHFVPLSPISDSPGNQVKVILDYNLEETSPLLQDRVNAVMEVYAANQTLLRTSSLPEPIILDDSEGTVQLATTFDDPTLEDVTTRALLTDGNKVNPISDPLETKIHLGEIKTGPSDQQ